MMGVHPRTVTKYADAGLLPSIRTSRNGHRRFPADEIARIIASRTTEADFHPERTPNGPQDPDR